MAVDRGSGHGARRPNQRRYRTRSPLRSPRAAAKQNPVVGSGQRLGSIFRSPSRYGRSTSGIVTEPSASW
jgi:hypothetical protein